MSNVLGTNIAAPIVPFTTDDQYPTHLAKYGKGGWRAVATVAERDAIPAALLEEGTAVYVVDTQGIFIRRASAWQALVTSGVGISSVALTDGHLIITKTDGTTTDLGNVKGADAPPLEYATKADLIDGSSTTLIVNPASLNGYVATADALNYSLVSMASQLINMQTMFVRQFAFK